MAEVFNDMITIQTINLVFRSHWLKAIFNRCQRQIVALVFQYKHIFIVIASQ